MTGSVNWSAITHAQILVTDNKTGKLAVYVAGIYAVPDPGQATVTFAFDDSLESAYTLGRTALSKYRFPATQYAIANTIGESGFLTLEQLYALRDQHGWEIAGHAYTVAAHNEPSGLDSLEGKALEEEVDGGAGGVGSRAEQHRPCLLELRRREPHRREASARRVGDDRRRRRGDGQLVDCVAPCLGRVVVELVMAHVPDHVGSDDGRR